MSIIWQKRKKASPAIVACDRQTNIKFDVGNHPKWCDISFSICDPSAPVTQKSCTTRCGMHISSKMVPRKLRWSWQGKAVTYMALFSGPTYPKIKDQKLPIVLVVVERVAEISWHITRRRVGDLWGRRSWRFFTYSGFAKMGKICKERKINKNKSFSFSKYVSIRTMTLGISITF